MCILYISLCVCALSYCCCKICGKDLGWWLDAIRIALYIGTAAFSEKQMLLMSWIHDIRCCKDCWHTFCGEYSLLVCSLRISSSGNVSKSWCIADRTIEIVSHIFVCIRWSNVKLHGLHSDLLATLGYTVQTLHYCICVKNQQYREVHIKLPSISLIIIFT